jgi:hypothetical protein
VEKNSEEIDKNSVSLVAEGCDCEQFIHRRGPPNWPAPGSEDTELGVLMEPEVGHGETKVYPRVQA